jgi:hypothetical protein
VSDAINALFDEVRATLLREGGADALDDFDRLTAAYERAIHGSHQAAEIYALRVHELNEAIDDVLTARRDGISDALAREHLRKVRTGG